MYSLTLSIPLTFCYFSKLQQKMLLTYRNGKLVNHSQELTFIYFFLCYFLSLRFKEFLGLKFSHEFFLQAKKDKNLMEVDTCDFIYASTLI